MSKYKRIILNVDKTLYNYHNKKLGARFYSLFVINTLKNSDKMIIFTSRVFRAEEVQNLIKFIYNGYDFRFVQFEGKDS